MGSMPGPGKCRVSSNFLALDGEQSSLCRVDEMQLVLIVLRGDCPDDAASNWAMMERLEGMQ